jgi:hypothetical protein
MFLPENCKMKQAKPSFYSEYEEKRHENNSKLITTNYINIADSF